VLTGLYSVQLAVTREVALHLFLQPAPDSITDTSFLYVIHCYPTTSIFLLTRLGQPFGKVILSLVRSDWTTWGRLASRTRPYRFWAYLVSYSVTVFDALLWC
jgi:hypothetical protein